VVTKELEMDPGMIVDMIEAYLKPVEHHSKINIYVNAGDFETINQHKERLRQRFDSIKTFTLKERGDIQPGGCIIETEAGIINAQLENQWRVLEDAFLSVME